MNPFRFTAALLLAVALAVPGTSDDKAKDDGFVPMFNGKDLTGWVNVNCAPGTFFVKDNEIITTGKPTGYLRTEKQYENFIAEFDWMHVPPKPGAVGNSGFFVWADTIPAVGTGYTRGIEVQVLVNLTYKNKKGEITATSQGDLFSIHGATCVPDRPHPDGWARCLPSENHCKGENEWNHYRVEASDGVIKLAVNGHVVSGVSKCKPRKGYLALESEGSECHFRNLKIKELPSTNPKKEEVADEDKGFKSLFTGLDLSGWKAREDWTPHDGVLHHGGNGRALYTDKEYGDTEFIVDFRFPQKGKRSIFVFRQGMRGSAIVDVARDGTIKANLGPNSDSAVSTFKDLKPAGEWNRLHATVRGKTLKVTISGKPATELDITSLATQGTFGVYSEGEMDFRNLFVRDLGKKD
jgi:hypothetical protein